MQILFTSASKPNALALARVLSAEGHIVYGADEERVWGTSPARYSRAYRRFHRLTTTWNAAELWKAIGERIDLVIPFGPLPGHILESLRARGANLVGETLVHHDYEFQDFVRDNIIDAVPGTASIVKVPTSFMVHSRKCIAEILSIRDSTFALQPLPCYDTDDEDTLVDVGPSAPTSSIESDSPLILSRSTLNDHTVNAIKRLPISETRPYRLIEIAEGGSFYSAHAFVHAGQLRTFVVANARATDRDFVIMGAGSPLYEVLYQFTAQLVDALMDWQTVVANHISLTFHVQDKIKHGNIVRKVTVISCHNEAHLSLVLLASIPELREALALAYTSPVLANTNWEPVQFPTDMRCPKAMFSAPVATSELARIFLAARPWRKDWWARLLHMSMMCWVWTVNFKEEMWHGKDPGPALCLWSILAAVQIVGRAKATVQGGRHIASGYVRWLITRVIAPIPLAILATLRYWIAILLAPWIITARGARRILAQDRLLLKKI